jgi:mono/diheme cytochrome c family protein
MFSGCSTTSERWYSEEQVQTGGLVFAMHCAACHGKQAQGLVSDWKKSLPDGSLPPPPLNGTAHTWHHSLPLLLTIIQRGGQLYNGTMPPFASTLSPDEQRSVIAWIQHGWPDAIYEQWQQRQQAVLEGES